MPNDMTAIHPSGLKIHFREDDHSYTDDWGRDYTSVTTMIHRCFEEFDASAVAANKSKRIGVPAEQYLREWEENRVKASGDGTRMHENCERQILGRYAEMHRPKDEEERQCFRSAWGEVEKLKAGFVSLQPEKIVFSPRFRAAGSIDLLARKASGEYRIFDWKRLKELKFEAFQGKTGTAFLTMFLPDCNFYHYALQLNIYELILKIEGYIPPDAPVERWLLVFSGGAFSYQQLPDLHREAALTLAWNISAELENVPF